MCIYVYTCVYSVWVVPFCNFILRPLIILFWKGSKNTHITHTCTVPALGGTNKAGRPPRHQAN